MSQYADDTLVILDGTKQSLQHCIEEINNFICSLVLELKLKTIHKCFLSL